MIINNYSSHFKKSSTALTHILISSIFTCSLNAVASSTDTDTNTNDNNSPRYGTHRIYVNNLSIHNNSSGAENATETADIPVYYEYTDKTARDAGYFACYRNKQDNLDAYDGDGGSVPKAYYTHPNSPVHITGLIRVPSRAKYQDGLLIFHPLQDTAEHIDQTYTWSGQRCNKYIPACQGECWAGGDTIGMYPLLEKEYTGEWPQGMHHEGLEKDDSLDTQK